MDGAQQLDTRNTSLAQISKYPQNSGNKLNDSDKKSNNSLQVGSPKKYFILITQKKLSSMFVKFSKSDDKKSIKIIINMS